MKASKSVILSLVLTIVAVSCLTGCSSGGSALEDDDDFFVVADLQGREDSLKLLFTEAMFNTITEKSRNEVLCREANRAALLPEDVQDLPNGQWYYTYENLIAGMARMDGFGTDSDDENINKLEIASFLANIAQETGTGPELDPNYGGPGCFIQEGSGTERDSCSYGGCVNTPGYDDVATCEANGYKCPAGDIGWSGRGPHQLSWGVNYLAFGQAMGEGSAYRDNPDLLTINPDTGIAGSIWFWGHAEKSDLYPITIPFKPSAHNVVVGRWIPTEFDISCGRTRADLGVITNIINGGRECGPKATASGLVAARNRVTYFNGIAAVMGVTVPDGWAVDCAEQRNFSECHSYMDRTWRCGNGFPNANSKCGTFCTVDGDCPTGETCFSGLSEEPCRKSVAELPTGDPL